MMRYYISLLSLLFAAGDSLAATFASCSSSQIAALETAIEHATNKSYAVIDHFEANFKWRLLGTGAFSQERCDRTLNAFRHMAVIATIGGTYGDVKICSIFIGTIIHEADSLQSCAGYYRHRLRRGALPVDRQVGPGTSGFYCGLSAPLRFLLVRSSRAPLSCHARFAVDVQYFGP
ncbi:hypothetical protein jhhlp_000811 [Lomentospora prolificans]|uniref:Fungal calcium binding protein domain-containing protein n=1 Tax=Lomentospora prolificans TaxID=41688 RepID=A0A2N3NJJ3_9PEZI|nr:hypothetical protein jhhlp_000811 [Lomentospora prolificans]